MKLENKVTIVTGGAKGNGLGIAQVFKRYGAKVYILDYDQETLEIAKKLNIKGYIVDIRNNEEVNKIIKEIAQENTNIDVLVNNAGVAKIAPFLETDDQTRDYHFDINIKGTWNVTKATIPFMNNGSIVNLSSVTGPMVADPGEVAYATTKAALIGFTKAIAMEFVDKIRCNAILPGYILTPMVEGIAKDTDSNNPESVIKSIASGVPMKRLGTIEELGELAAFLASEESSYITAQSFVIDGGATSPETNSVGI